MKSCFDREDEKLAESLAEELEKLSNSLCNYNKDYGFIELLEPDTLNYSIDVAFLNRYRSLNRFLSSDITDTEFESLCAYYVGLLGCHNFRVTRKSSDQGLDFYGTISIDRDATFAPISEQSFMIGQAKLYTSKVGTPEIREFVGSIELLKGKIFSSETYRYRFARELKYYSLINPIFISSSSFSKDAKSLCNQTGIRMVDVVQLIMLLTTVDQIFDNDSLVAESLTGEIANIQQAESN